MKIIPDNISNNLKNVKQTKIQQKLLSSELRYRRLFETAQDGILILDGISGKITDANPFLADILGYSREELLGKQLWQIGVFKDIDESKKAFLELKKNNYIRYKDLPLQTKNGKKIDVEFVSNVYMVDDQRVIQCNIRDISDRKKAEDLLKFHFQDLERLSKSQEQAKKAMLNVMEDLEVAKNLLELEKAKDEAVFASIGEGLISVDNNRKIVIMNKAAEKMLETKNKQMIGHDILEFALEDEVGQKIPLSRRPTFKALNTGKLVSNTYYFVRKNKTRFPIAITVTPIKLGKNIIGAIDVFRDITREKEIDRAKNEFVSLASHQLRAPLGISKWYIEAILNAGYFDTVPEIAKDYFNEIYKSNERLLILVRDLLSISRIDQGKVRNAPEYVNIPDLLKNILKNMNILAAKNKVSLDLDLKKVNMQKMYIDPLRFQETIENLIANAIMYSPVSGKVSVTVDSSDRKIFIKVKDRGIGISSTDKKMLFTRFFRSEEAKVKNTEGSGLGLYVAKSYVDGWGGNISVVSSENKGSTFSVTVPLVRKNI